MNYSTIRFTKGQRKHLTQVYKSQIGKPSLRAHIILLLFFSFSQKDVADICFCSPDTVSNILHRFQHEGLSSIYDKPRSGASAVLDASDEAFLFKALKESPKEYGYVSSSFTIPLMIALLKNSRGKTISESALKKLLHKRGWVFTRPKLIPPETEPFFVSRKNKVLELLQNLKENEILLFADESDFELLSYLSGKWMPKGKQAEIPTPGKNQVLCVFGFFNPHTKEFFYKTVKGRKEKNGKNFIVVMHQLRKQFQGKKIHVVLDNASIHNKKTTRLKKFREKYGSEVEFHFLPKRAPQLNPIERFWQFLKKNICANIFYKTLEELTQAFQRFVWHYREKKVSYNFNLRKLIAVWEKWPEIQDF